MKNLLKLSAILFTLTLVSACTVLPSQPSAKLNFVDLADGQTFELTAAPLTHQIGRQAVSMLAYNGSIPGPVLRVVQGSSAKIILNNKLSNPTTLHAHGIRMKNKFDGVPDVTQDAVEPGASFEYELEFPDAGVFWYHPHVREDRDQELGLYGVILVSPADAASWPAVSQEEILVIDDILLTGGKAVFEPEIISHALMGRYGNTMLVNGQTGYSFSAKPNSTTRLFLVNAANARPFNLAIPGAEMTLIGADNGLYQKSQVVDSIVLGPSERAIVDVKFGQAKKYVLENKIPGKTIRLATVNISDEAADEANSPASQVADARLAEMKNLLSRPADKTLRLSMLMGGMMGGHEHHGGAGMMMGTAEPIEWEDDMGEMNAFSSSLNVVWQLIDQGTGKINENIDWSFHRGDMVKIKIINDKNSMHPMQHPIHLHGQRFAVLSVDGVANNNLVWKDTVLVPTGSTVELAVEMANPGMWALHCHIPEHMESGMMAMFEIM